MQILEITGKESLTKIISEHKNVVVDFYSTECPPCEAFAPKFHALHELYGEDIQFIKIFRQENRDLAQELGISSSPSVIFFKDGQQTGELLAGAITRAQVMKGLQALIADEARNQEILANIIPENHSYEVAIIGGGPAGLTAGIYLAQAKIKTCIIDQALPGGNVKNTHLVSNYPGFPEAQNGYMLAHHMTEQTQHAGVDFFSASTINTVDLEHKTLLLDDYISIQAKTIIIATGTSPRKLNIPGETDLIGKGISFCATCDAKYYQDKDVIIIGGGNSAIEEADFIAKFAKTITIIHQFDALTANKEAQEKCLSNPKIKILFSHEPRSFAKHNNTTQNKIQVKIENLKNHQQEILECDGVFMFIGMQGNAGGFSGLDLDQRGYIKTNEDMETNLPNIYAIGDVTSKKYRQITTAINDGTIAAMSISRKH